MNELADRLEELLKTGVDMISQSNEADLSFKSSVEKWSKKEILGHLIDSGLHNWQRFTRIQFEAKPFKIERYKQNELVIANNYQNAETKELIHLWLALNERIISIMKEQTDITFDYAIELDEGQLSNLRFLMIDYVDHLGHHLKQILK